MCVIIHMLTCRSHMKRGTCMWIHRLNPCYGLHVTSAVWIPFKVYIDIHVLWGSPCVEREKTSINIKLGKWWEIEIKKSDFCTSPVSFRLSPTKLTFLGVIHIMFVEMTLVNWDLKTHEIQNWNFAALVLFFHKMAIQGGQTLLNWTWIFLGTCTSCVWSWS